jgi:hypothetical protein
MNIKIEKGLLNINVADLLDHLEPESKLYFVEALACDGDVIKYVTQQILDDCTENGFYGSTSVSAQANPQESLDFAKRDVARRSSEVAAKEIKRLEDALMHSEKVAQDLRTELFALRERRREMIGL